MVFVAGVLVVVSGLYAYVLYVLNDSGDPSRAVASVELQKGAIRALADQKDDFSLAFSLALDARRQPGSSFKPFVLATALRGFVSPEATYYLSRNLDFDYEGERVQVKNYAGLQRGRIPLDRAMARLTTRSSSRLTGATQ